jgi:nicotinamide riboside kinase
LLINFIGCPSSGKTTTAAMLFAKFKERGIPSEFICEEARKYIMTQRWNRKIPPEISLSLSDRDQQNIMTQQFKVEEMTKEVCGNKVIVICDSSALNALLYMTPGYREQIPHFIEIAKRQIDLAFYLHPVRMPNIFDPNRIHDEATSLRINEDLLSVFSQLVPSLRLIPVDGSPQERLNKVLMEVEKQL